ncbi:MAG: HAD-IIB family hydrolase [Arcanobacterium sp.]|nr:HAD-IIB family hydrolase [Arcanobacterium sp.]
MDLKELLSNTIRDYQLPKAGPELFIAVDLDGTMTHHDMSVSPRVITAVQEHLAAGTNLVICTGRGIVGAQVAMEQLGIESGYAVCSNGAIVLAVGDTRKAHSETTLREISPTARQENPPVFLLQAHTFNPSSDIEILSRELPAAIMAVESIDDMRRITAEFPPGELSGESIIVPLAKLSHPEATRLTVRVPELSAQELLTKIAELGLHGVEYAVGWSAWMDVSPKGITKATGLADVLKTLKISQENTVAIGDSGNDREMLRWAKLGVAMGNAPEYVAQWANIQTADVQHDGAALVLEALLRN